MQPYGPELESDKGLFTFYREQQEAENGLKSKISADHLQKILGKVIRATHDEKQEKKRTYQDKIKEKPLFADRQQLRVKQNTPPQSSSAAKRQELKLKKSVIQDPKDAKISPQKEAKPEGKYAKNTTLTAANTASIHHQLSSHDENFMNQESFRKYMSDFDSIKLKKKAIFQQILPSSPTQKHDKKSLSPENRKNQNSDEKLIQISKSKLFLHFKKMALEPQEFGGLTEVDKNFVPITKHKRQKSGLKSYRKQRMKLQDEKRANETENKTKADKAREKYSIFDNDALKSSLPVDGTKDDRVKLIRVQKISRRTDPRSELDKSLIEQSRSSDILAKLKLNLPLITTTRQRENSHGTSMSLELMKSNELKSKYQIRELEKQDQNIINANEKMRNQLKNLRNSPKKINHYISLKNNPDQSSIHSERQMNFGSGDIGEPGIRDSLEQLRAGEISFKKQKEIFCKREEYLRGYSKRLKRNKFSLNKEDEVKLKSFIDGKKREMLENLMEKLNFM